LNNCGLLDLTQALTIITPTTKTNPGVGRLVLLETLAEESFSDCELYVF
jgi:hypothetical protein